ncbi:MAG: type VI secretion system lipoprotein TssJ [Alphaproteobacteria bacterium]|nr:type VI secretion system lipoprotein TssJ [Alphaproteobacteria bacterium]
MGRWLRGMVAFGLAAILAGCAAPPAPPPPTVVKLTLSASADVNPDPAGAAAPVVVRVYQLGSTSGFDAAEFFQIFNQDQATLKTDLIKRDDFLLAPGQTKTTTLQPTDQVKAIGIFAAYRNFQPVIWRADAEVPPHKTTVLTVTAGRTGVVVKSAAPAAQPAS